MSVSVVIAALLAAIPRLSYRSDAIPRAANPSASILRLLLLPGNAGLFPLRSVGPDPAMIRATGTGCFAAGSSRVPNTSPVEVLSVSSSLVIASGAGFISVSGDLVAQAATPMHDAAMTPSRDSVARFISLPPGQRVGVLCGA